jgi:hypothetical protein
MPPASNIAYQEYPAEDRTTYIIAAITLPLIFAYAAVLLRFPARRSAAVRIRVDDYLVLIGLVGCRPGTRNIDRALHADIEVG